jgi:hypothetical protein
MQFVESHEYRVERCYFKSDLDVAHNEDIFSSYDSSRGLLTDTLIDGCNSPTGWCVLIETSAEGVSEGCQTIRVDALNWSTGAFAAYDNARDVLFLRCRARDSHRPCGGGRGEPRSNSLTYGAGPGLPAVGPVNVRFEECEHHGLINPGNMFWDKNRMLSAVTREVDFVPLSPVLLTGGVFDL